MGYTTASTVGLHIAASCSIAETELCGKTYRDRCPVRAGLRIIRRARTLDLPADHPAAVFTPSGLATPSDVLVMCASDVCESLRTTARRLYNITDPTELALFSCHSIRVGACVALHANGAIEMQIKFALRWRSNSFWMYLRNVPLAASQTNRLIGLRDPMDGTNPLPVPH